MTLRVRTLDRSEHLDFLATRPSASFLQCPSWGEVKVGWRSESIGWVDAGDKVVGAGLVLYRQIPRVPRHLAYLPEGPVIDWTGGDLARWLEPMLAHLKRQGAFTVKMGPPVVVRQWEAETVKRALAEGSARRLRDVPADETSEPALAVAKQLAESGWLQGDDSGAGFGDYQPRYVFQLPLAGRSLDAVFRGLNQLWRRNIRKAEKAGVEVSLGGYDDLPAFHAVYQVTAERDRFTGRPLTYFQRMWRALAAEDPERIRLYLARHEGEVLAATLAMRVGGHVWYSYGASADHKREVRPSNAVQWRMIEDAHAAGAETYDLRGISDTLDDEHPLFGLIRFKLGTGGRAVEYLGEWDFALNRPLDRLFQAYLRHRR